MSDNTPDTRDTIRQALAEATPGPWEVVNLGDVHIAKDYKQVDDRHQAHWIADMCDDEQDEERMHADAWMIANAPEWLRWALDEIELLKGLHQHTGDQLDAEIKTSAYLRQELELMRQVANTNADKASKALDELKSRVEELKRLYTEKCRDWARVVDEHNQMRAKLDAKDKEIAAARAEADEQRLLKIKYNTDREKMRIFLRDCIRQVCWGDMDGGDLQEKAEAFGFLRPEPYDPDKHGEIDAEAGDTIYAFSGPLEVTP